jgi:ATP synthase subunit 6
MLNLIYSPLEHFQIYCVFHFFGLSLTNQFVSFFLVLVLFIGGIFGLLNPKTYTLYLIPNRYQYVAEFLYVTVLNLVLENVSGRHAQKFFPAIFFLFMYVSALNFIGMLPYGVSITGQAVVTCSIALILFTGVLVLGIKRHKFNFFSMFLPSGTSFLLSFLIVPIEIISFIFKPISLAVRLFCNVVAGHTLLLVISGFWWSLVNTSGFITIFQIFPLLVLIPLYGLELAIGIIQAFVISLLACVSLNTMLNLH